MNISNGVFMVELEIIATGEKDYFGHYHWDELKYHTYNDYSTAQIVAESINDADNGLTAKVIGA